MKKLLLLSVLLIFACSTDSEGNPCIYEPTLTTEAMFYNNSAFNQDIGNWNTSSVTDMSYTFRASSAFNQDLSMWNVVNVTNSLLFDADTPQWTLPKPIF